MADETLNVGSSEIRIDGTDVKSPSAVSSVCRQSVIHAALESSEILRVILHWLDFQSLLSIRLTNKIWNDEACKLLRVTSFVHLCGKSEESVAEINDIIDAAEAEKRSSPFRNFFIYFKEFPSEGLQRILNRPRTEVIGLNYLTEGCSSGNQKEKWLFLRHFLAVYGLHIGHIIYVFDSDIESEELENEENAIEFQLPQLISFEYWERDVNTTTERAAFLIEIMHRAPNLHKLATNTHNVSIYNVLIAEHVIEKIMDLHLIDCRLSYLNIVFGSELPKLKALALQIWQNTSIRMTSTNFTGITRKVSNTIEELAVSFIDFTLVGIQFIPPCPKLRHFLLHDWRGSFSIFNAEKLPKLQRVYLSSYNMDIASPIHFLNEPHPSVTHFAYRGTGMDGVIHSESLASLLDYIPLKFPNLSSIAIIIDFFPVKILFAIMSNFSQVENLEIQKFSSITDSISVENMEDFFTGINRFTLERSLRAGIVIEDVARSPSIIDMGRLKHLKVLQNGQGIILTNNGIKYGIARIPNLQNFEFDMNPMLSVDVIKESLRHLPEIVIRMDVKSMEEAYDEDVVGDFEDMLTTLSGSMRQVVIDHSILNPIDKFDLRNY